VILEALKTLHGQMTVLIVTHRFEEIRDLLDGVVRADDGRVGYWNPVGENVDQRAIPPTNPTSAKQPTTVN
jgi:ABC-type thiamine transport system ATPase subunit